MILTIIILANFLNSYPVSHQGDLRDLEFEPLSIANGLSHNDVVDIYQDNSGFMWFATNNGLNRYDGIHFTIFRKNDSTSSTISHDVQNCIAQDRSGTMWIGTYGGGLNSYETKTGRFTHFGHSNDNPESLNSNFVTVICPDSQGQLWIGTTKGLNIVNPETSKIRDFKQANEAQSLALNHVLNYAHINHISPAPDGTLWIAAENGLYRLNPSESTVTRFFHDEEDKNSLIDNMITAVHVDSGGIVWVGTPKGLDRFDPATGMFTHFSASQNPDGLTGNIISAVYKDSEGLVWIGTSDRGIIVLNPLTNRIYHFIPGDHQETETPGRHIQKIFEDRSGLLWISVWHQGLYKVDRNKRKFAHYAAGPVYSIYEGNDGIVWMGTHDGKLIRLNRSTGQQRSIHCVVNGKASGCIGSIAAEPPDTLWIGMQFNGLGKFSTKTGELKNYLPDPSGQHSNQVTQVIRSKEGIIWLGGRNGNFYSFNPQSETFSALPLPQDEGIPEHPSLILDILEDSKGNIWVGGDRIGLFKYDRKRGHFTHYITHEKNQNCLNDNDVWAILEDKTGTLWLATSGGGLNCLDPVKGTFSHYRMNDGLPSDNVKGILEDDTGTLWLSTARGISRFNPLRGEFRNYGLRSGIQGLEFNSGAFFKNEEGDMFFGGINGINTFQPSCIKDNTHRPPIVFTGFKRSDTPEHIDFAADLTLSYKDHSITFECAALDYVDPSKNQYKYKVSGLHDRYIYLGYQSHVTLNRLKPGRYVLKAAGSNNDGIWSNVPAEITFTITPPFWHTWWFRVLCLLLLAGLVFLVYRFRKKRLTSKLQKDVILQKLFDKHGLSPREQEIIPYILDGKSNKEIEDTLFISLATVKSHVYNIFKKMGIKSRVELISLVNKAVKGGK